MREIEAVRVIIETPSRRIVIDEPQVAVMDFKGGRVYQVQGRETVEEPSEAPVAISQEDVELVAQQAGVSLEEARKALEEVGGDLAQAIILLRARKGG